MKNIKKISKNFTKVAAVAASFLLIGGIASAAEIYHSNMITFRNTGATILISSKEGQELSAGETTTKVIEQEYSDSNNVWLEKKVIDETSTAYKSNNNEDWIPYEVTERITEYKYEKYSDAVEDVQFTNAFTKDYMGTAYYRESQCIPEGMEAYSNNMNCSISADITIGSNTFNIEQLKLSKYDEFIVVDSAAVTIGADTNNERKYTASSGYEYLLEDYNESGKDKTKVVISGKEYRLILTFTDMDDASIYDILESVDVGAL